MQSDPLKQIRCPQPGIQQWARPCLETAQLSLAPVRAGKVLGPLQAFLCPLLPSLVLGHASEGQAKTHRLPPTWHTHLGNTGFREDPCGPAPGEGTGEQPEGTEGGEWSVRGNASTLTGWGLR